MLRISRLLLSAKPLITTTTHFLFKPSQLVSSNFAFFSETPRHSIFELIQNQNVQQNLDKINQTLLSLDDQVRQQAIQAILQRIYDGELPLKVLQNQKLSVQLKKHPNLHFQAYYFRLIYNMDKLQEAMEEQDRKRQKSLVKEIGDNFIVSFDILKKIDAKQAAPKEIQLLRSFADYNNKFLAQLVEIPSQKEVINKSKQAYKIALNKMSALLKSTEEEKKQYEGEVNPNQTQAEKQQRQQFLLQIEQSKFSLVEDYAQIVFELMNIEQQLEQKKKQRLSEGKKGPRRQQEQSPFNYSKECLTLEPLFDKAIKNYTLISNKIVKSKYYFKLKKIIEQLRQQKKVRELMASRKPDIEKQEEMQKLETEFQAKMDQLYLQTLEQLKHIEGQDVEPEDLCDYVLTTVGIRLHRLVEQAENEDEQDLVEGKQMGEQVTKILSFVANQSLRKKALVFIIPQVKENFKVDIEDFVERIPRHLRTQRRNRNRQ